MTLERCTCGQVPETTYRPESDYVTSCACGKSGESSWSARLARASWNKLIRAERKAVA